jgi:uncharacterized protein (DUF58 family)
VSTRRAGFTTRATCLLAAGITAVLCGVIFGEVDLVRAGVLAAAAPCAAALLVQRSRVRISNRRRVEPAQAYAGQSVTVHLTITNRALLRTSALMLEDSLPDRVPGKARFVVDPLGGHESRPVSYRIPALGRGRYRVGPLQMRLSDPFGLIDLTRSFTATSEFLVAPVVDPLPPLEPPRSDDLGDNSGSRSVGTHGADDQSTREYRTGDDLRKIHWRSSARTGALMVRQEERPWQGQNTVLLDSRASAHATAPDPDEGDPDDLRLTSSFEWAVSAVASIGTHVLLAGRKLSLVGDPAAADRLRFGDPARLTEHLAEVRETSRADLGQAAELLRAAARDSTLLAVLGRLDPKALRSLADAHRRGRSAPAFALLLDVDSWARPSEDARASSRRGTEVEATAQVLRSAGWRVVVVRHGDTVAQAWRLLLAGSAAGPRAAVPAR